MPPWRAVSAPDASPARGFKALCQDLADRHARRQARVGVLEDVLHAACAVGASRPDESLVRSMPSKRTSPDGRLDQAQHRAPDRGLAGAGFSDEADDLAAWYIEGDILERAHDGAAAKSPPA